MRPAEKVIITTAVTGSVNVPSQSPYLPLTAEQVLTAALEAIDAGSAIVHLHARHPDGRPAFEPEVFEQASPLLRVTPDDPDFFVVHGSRDTLVDPGQARAFVDALRQTSKRTVVYAELPGAQHAFDIFPSIRSQHLVRATDRFLTWHWNSWRREKQRPAPVA